MKIHVVKSYIDYGANIASPLDKNRHNQIAY